MLASALTLVSGTGHIGRKLRKLAGFHVFEVLLHAPFDRPEDADPLSLKPHQGATPYAAHHNGIHSVAGKRFHGLALTLRMVSVAVADGFKLSTGAVQNHERRSRAEMAVDLAFKSFINLNRKSNFHFSPSSAKKFDKQTKKITPSCQGRDDPD
jgi:hypothetical protein